MTRREGESDDPLRIEVLTECSSRVGLGHVRRSATLARHLAAYGEVHVRVDAEATTGIARLLDSLLAPGSWSLGLEKAAGDVYVLDIQSREQGSYACRYVDRLTRTLALDWYEPRWLPAVSVNLLDVDAEIRSAYELAGRASAFFHDSSYAILRDDVLTLGGQVRDLQRASGIHVLVSMGGADPAGCTLDAVESLARMPQLFDVASVVLGPLFTDEVSRSRLQTLSVKQQERWRVLDNPVDFPALLADADVVLCSGGGTLLEAFFLARPCVVYPQGWHEAEHARELCDAEICVGPESLEQVLSEPQLRLALAARAGERVDGKGVVRIASEVNRLAAACARQEGRDGDSARAAQLRDR